MALTLAQLTNPGTLNALRQLVLNALAGNGFIAKDGTGSGNLSATGSPRQNADVVITITSAGEPGTAAFTYSLDGGTTTVGPVTVPTSLTYALGGSGVTLTFIPGPAGSVASYEIGDVFSFPLAFPNFPVTAWQSGGVARTLAEVDAQITFVLAQSIAQITAGGFLQSSTGSWLDLLALNVYGLEREPAVIAEGEVVLTDSAAQGPFTIAPGTVYVATAAGQRYSNVNGGVLPLSGSLTLTFAAEQPGSSYNAGNSTIDVLVTSLPGVTVNNPAIGSTGTWLTTFGADLESDPSLQARCSERWPTLGPTVGVALVYDFVAKQTSQNVTRTLVIPDPSIPGQVDVYLAGIAGPVSGADVTAVQNAIDPMVLVTNTCVVASATGVPITINATVYAYAKNFATVNGSGPGSVAAAIQAFIEAIPLGGTVYLNDIVAILSSPSVPGVRNIVITSPTGDTVLTAGQVATLAGSITVVSV